MSDGKQDTSLAAHQPNYTTHYGFPRPKAVTQSDANTRLKNGGSSLRQAVYSHDSNPSVDPPYFRKSKTYVEDMIVRGQAVRLDENSVQLIDVHGTRDRGSKEYILAQDWRNKHLSFLPQELHKRIGRYLRITTKQIHTPQLTRLKDAMENEPENSSLVFGIAPGGSVLA